MQLKLKNLSIYCCMANETLTKRRQIMNLFEFHELAKDTLIEARLKQVANFLAEQNDTTSIVTRKYDMIKVNYKNSPYFERNKEFWRDIETPLDRITPKEFTLNPLKSDEDFMQELKFEYNNRFNTEGNRIKKFFENSHHGVVSGKGKSIATFDNCKTLGDCHKKIEGLGVLKPEYSLDDIEQAIAYNVNEMVDAYKAQENLKKWITNAEQTISKLKNNETRGDKND